MAKVIKKAQTGKSVKDSASYNTPSAWADMHGFKTDRQMDSTLKANKVQSEYNKAKDRAKANLDALSKKSSPKKAQKGKNVPKGMVESEMFPGKMIPKSKSNYDNGEYAKMLEAGKPKVKAAMKPKAKDGKWIQKAVNPKHKGYCTPMTKATCTPKRKALAKTFKAMAKKRK
jgi:hypothetical protein